MLRFIVPISFIIIFAGCVQEPTYSETINSRSMPTTEQQKQEECAFIRQEIARMQSLKLRAATQPCNPQYGLCIGPIMIAKANSGIATLESRASQVQCDAAFSTVKILNAPSNSIKECIAACKENTTRTSTECFDTCNKK